VSISGGLLLRKGRPFRHAIVISVLLLLFVVACSDTQKSRSLVVYTSVDQVYSEPVFRQFEKDTGIKVLAVYDVEASKTTGLVNRLIAEAGKPQANVFWNGEFAQTILLKEKGVLKPYQSKQAEHIPEMFRDVNGYWTGFGGRARVIIVNRDLLSKSDYPQSLDDFISSRFPADRIAIANPVFGTTATHGAAMYSLIGADKARSYFRQLRDRGVKVVNGNSVVRDLVAGGQLLFGLTDTDDALVAMQKGLPVDIVFPDQHSHGTLLIPNTVALINNEKNQNEASIFIDYLLGKKAGEMMIESGWTQVTADGAPTGLLADQGVAAVKFMNVSLIEVQSNMKQAKIDFIEMFIR